MNSQILSGQERLNEGSEILPKAKLRSYGADKAEYKSEPLPDNCLPDDAARFAQNLGETLSTSV